MRNLAGQMSTNAAAAAALLRSCMNKTGYRGVQSDRERFQACCNLNHSRQLFLGRFATVEEAAAAFLQHWEKDHP